jgi:IS30 family transposase
MERLSDSERDVLWDLYEAGESQRAMSRHLGRSPSTVRTQLVSARWRRRAEPVEWCSLRLSLSEREEVSRGLARDESLRSAAGRLGRSPSTVSREVKTDGGHGRYRATVAHRASRRRAKRPKTKKLAECPRLRKAVERNLELWWSPSQISRWLMRAYPDDEEMRVSHETICQSLFVQGRGTPRKELWRSLRTRRAVRRPQARAKSIKGQIRDTAAEPSGGC